MDAVKDFLSVIGPGPESVHARLAHLERSLDRLAFLQHDVGAPPEPVHSMPPPPATDFLHLRTAVAAQFPKLGSYHLPSPVIRIGQGEIQVADAIDDIAEIASELYDVLWHSEHTGADDAVWHFRHSYQHHWSAHVRGLQFHLHGFQARGRK